MHFGSDAIQAMLALDDPARPVIPYQLNMLLGLLYNPAPVALLNLGLGGGSFERFFTAFMPGLSLTSVESNPDVIALQREYFPIPCSPVVVQGDAVSFLSGGTDAYDLILCDIFGTSETPGGLARESFYADAFRCLTARGVLAVNLLPQTESGLLTTLLAVRASFDHLLLLELPGFRNILLFCLKQAPPQAGELKQRVGSLLDLAGIDLALASTAARLLPKPQR
jgi:spermidine synthase